MAFTPLCSKEQQLSKLLAASLGSEKHHHPCECNSSPVTDGNELMGSVHCLLPACKASSWVHGELGQSITPMEPTDVDLNLHGKFVPKELIKRVLELLTASFASVLLLMLPSKRAKCSWRKQQ